MTKLTEIEPMELKRQATMRHCLADATRCAFFITKTGEVPGKTSACLASADVVAFLVDITASQFADKPIYITADKRSVGKIIAVDGCLASHPNVHRGASHRIPPC